MINSINKRVKSIAFGYACFALMWLTFLCFILYIMGWDGFKLAIEEPALISDTLIYIAAMVLINGLMAVAIWNVIHMSKKKKRLLIVFSFSFASVYVIGLLYSLWKWAAMETSNWFTPQYSVIPLMVLTIAYGYFAFKLKRAISFSNKSLPADR